MIFFNPTAKAELRISCPHCEMINTIDLKFVSTTDAPKEYPAEKCKRCLKSFSLVLWLNIFFNVRKEE